MKGQLGSLFILEQDLIYNRIN